MAARVDRLRGVGNGVVPLVAAYAFCTLATQAGLDVECLGGPAIDDSLECDRPASPVFRVDSEFQSETRG
jgi:hypothetical protein